jgi:hypothetical protein
VKPSSDGRNPSAKLGGENVAILLDTGLLVAHYSARDPHKARAQAIIAEILDGKYGTPIVSDYVVLELLNYASSARGSRARLRGVQGHLLAKGEGHWVDLVNIDERLFEESVEFFSRVGAERGLSFTDCSTVALGKALGIETVASFDGDFDGLMSRVC